MEIENIVANKQLEKSLLNFVEEIIEKRTLHIVVENHNLFRELVDSEIIKIVEEKYEILRYDIVGYYFLKESKKRVKFKFDVDFGKNAEFLNNISDSFLLNGYVPNFHILENHLWQFVITESNSKLKCNFIDYLKSFTQNSRRREIFQFIECYSLELPNLILSTEELYSSILILQNIAKSDAQYNLPVGTILNGVKQKCKNEYQFGIRLFDLVIAKNDKIDNFIGAIVSGLYETKREVFFESHLKTNIESELHLNEIFIGLSNVIDLTGEECELLIELYDKFHLKEELLNSTLSLLISILKTENNLYFKECFTRIDYSIKNEKTVFFLLNNLWYLKDLNEEKSDFLVSLIKQEYFTIDKYIKGIEQFFYGLKDIESFKKVILAFALFLPFKSVSKAFNSFLRTTDKLQLDEFLIELFIDNQAAKRYLGHDLFKELSLDNSYEFSFNLLSLEKIKQYKLWVSITQDYMEPKNYIPALLPLLNSESDIIKESLISKLEEIAKDYGGSINKILVNNLDLENQNNKEILERIQDYISEFTRLNIDIKNPIKELNPYYCERNNFKKFSMLFQTKMNRNVNKGAEENSLFGLLGVSTINLAKGGGWKVGNRSNISKLGRFEASFSLPRSYFIHPDEYELEKGLEMREDWDDKDFEEIKKALENE